MKKETLTTIGYTATYLVLTAVLWVLLLENFC